EDCLMADRYQSYLTIPVDTTSVSVDVELKALSTGGGVRSATPSLLVGAYCRQGGTLQTLSFSALSCTSVAYSAGGWIEYSCTLMGGMYRFAGPDAALARGADRGVISVALADGSAQPCHIKYVLTNPSVVGCNILSAVVETCGPVTAK